MSKRVSQPDPCRMKKSLAWLAVTAAASVIIAALSVQLVSPQVRAGGQPSSVDTLSDWWYAAFLLFVPVAMVARRSAWLALPAVAVAVVPQFEVATIGIERMVADDGLEALLYLFPMAMTALCLVAALVGGLVRLVEFRSQSLTPVG
jgi:hypothetical protein